MSRGKVFPTLLVAGILGAAALLLTGVLAGSSELSAQPVAAAIAPFKQAHREQLEKLRESPRLMGVRRSQLESIAECESHGDPRATSSDGLYRGKYQFHRGTWAGIGGRGDPAKAPELEQDLRAAMLLRESGPGHWPNCG